MSDEQTEDSAKASSDAGFTSFGAQSGEPEVTLDAIYDIPVQVSVVLGKTSMSISQLLKLGRGAVVELDKNVGDPMDVYVNNRLVARGEIIIVENRIGITLTEIIRPEKEN